MAAPRVGCIGELLVEFVCAAKNGHHRRVGTYSGPYPSGAPGIFIDQAARCGAAAIFAGAVGDDAFGQVILERLIADGVDPRLIKIVNGVPTGSAFVSYNDDGSRDFVFNIEHSAAARFDVNLAALKTFRLDFMHVSGSALGNLDMCARIVAACQALHAEGVRISFDPNVRKELIGNPAYFGAVRDLMSIASIFLPSEEDAATLFPGEEFKTFARRLLDGGMDHVVLKKGGHGAEAMNRAGEHVSLPAHEVDVVDPTGAGDCFCATFVSFAGSRSLADAMKLANAAGALAVGQLGPMEGNSGLAAIEAFLRA